MYCRKKREKGLLIHSFIQQTFSEHLLCALCPKWPMPFLKTVSGMGLGFFPLGPSYQHGTG